MNYPSLYIHIPFCSRKCLFCSFVIAVSQEHRRKEYVRAVASEMNNHTGTRLRTIYLGGGTPSHLDEDHLDDLMNAIRKNFSWDSGIEITIEANPESINAGKAQFLKRIGFNRVSLGVQSLDDRFLKFLGRNHNAAAALEANRVLREAGFDNINLDLMYAFPGQTGEELEKDVKGLAALGSEHLSLYTLTIEPNSRFHAAQIKLDDDEKLAQQYVLIGRLLQEYGFAQYEISNFAKQGFESAHNRNYWQGGPYIGLGVGAHAFDGRRRSWNTPRLQEYLDRASQGIPPVEGCEDLTDEQLTMEKVLLGLRMNKGIRWDLVPADRRPQVEVWIKDGFLARENGNLKATDRGRLVLDELSGRLI
ncbi:MAG: radical SAM family heme chaperone HemW [Candidatus Omnitrophica bacterium]|nr:radical SAM family heme chaperone HemW [Candidatus Omnitrophota bacterium]MDE2222156.1 radical SAM family heme chaperone HemW [Candidatus Omnitrophota bacterium]